MFLLVALLACGHDAHAADIGLTFQGNVQTLNTGGSITLSSPSGIVVDSAGDVFIADTVSESGRIVEVNAQGTASVLTISGVSPALGSLSSLAIDGAGNLYIADTGHTRVVKVTSSGAGSVIGTGSVTLTAPHGVAVDQSGDLFISDGTGESSRIVEVTSGGAAAPLTITVSPALNSPEGLAVDVSGKLYIADSANNRIVTVASGSTTGVVLSTVLDTVALSNPSSVAVDRIGNVFIADTGNNRIFEADTAGDSELLLNSGFLGGTTLIGPLGVAVDDFGGVYVADTGHSRALVVDPVLEGNNADLTSYNSSLNKTAVGFGHITLGSSTPTSLILNFTVGSPVENLGGVNVFTSGTQNLDFQIVSGANTTCNSSTEQYATCTVEVSFLPTAPGLRKGALVLYDPDSNPVLTVPLYGFGDAPVAALSPNTGTVIGTGGLTLDYPYQVALDGAGNMYVSDYFGSNVTKISAGGAAAAVVSLGTPGDIPVDNITGVAVDGAGNLFIGDHENSRILVVTPSGVVSVLNISGASLGYPTALAFDAAGSLYIADFTNGRILEVSSLLVSGSTSTGIGTVIPTGGYSFDGSTLSGLTIDPQGNIYAAARTQNSSSIIKVTASGVASALAIPNNITPTLNNPQGVAADAMGNIYIADSIAITNTNPNTTNARIVKITTAGVASVLSLSGQASSLASSVYGVTVDPLGNLYIPDWSNSRLVFVNVSGAPLTFPTPTGSGTTDTADGAQTATVTNLGNQPLVFSANPTYTADFSSNGNDTNPCTSSTLLSPGTPCDVSVNFTPQSVGSLSAGITVTNNTLNVTGSTEQVAVSGTGLSSSDSTATTVTTSPTSLVLGQTVTVTATVADTATGHTSNSPTGSVTFTDAVGATVTSLNNGVAVNLSNKIASLPGVVLSGAGTHTITANYSGSEGQYVASSNAATVVVSKASVTVTGPATQPVSVSSGQTASVTITVTAPSATSTPPSGSINYTILNASGTSSIAPRTAPLTGVNGSSTATVPIPGSLAPGSYTISITYSGDNNYAVPSSAITISLQIGQLTPTITWTPASSSIPYGTALGGALLNASAASGGTSVRGTFTYKATIAGGAPVTITSASVLSAGSYTLTATFTPTDTTTYATVTAQVPLTVTQLTPAVTLTSSASSIVLTNPLLFTATVSSTTTTPTGTVSFLDGTTPLGQGTLSNGVATLSTSSLAAGNRTITAVYSGNANFRAATSGALTESVLDFSLTNVGGSGIASASQTVTPGGTASYPLTILPTNGTIFPAPITLSLAGLPSGAIATVGPSSWTAVTTTTWSFPANTALPTTATTLAIQTPSVVARLEPGTQLRHTLSPVFLGLLLLPLAGMRRRLGKTLGRAIFTLLLLVAGASAMAGLSGCGAPSGFFSQPTQTYTMTVTATSGTLSHATTITLTLE
jgi:DNA-binding beta-propeller fold protein YncE